MNQRRAFFVLYSLPVVLFLTGVVLAAPHELLNGLLAIVTSRSLLLTDYLAVGGSAATLVNAGLCGLVAVTLLRRNGVQANGPFIAAVYTVVGFAFFGKNIFNIWPILTGVFLYTRVQGIPFRNSLLVALFGTTLSPLVSFFTFVADIPFAGGLFLGVVLGIAVGFVLPPLASHMLRFHDGYNIYNIGFTGGIVGSFFVAVIRSFGFEIVPEVALLATDSRFFEWYFTVLFLLLIALGLYLSHGEYRQLGVSLRRILGSTGRLVSDFVQIGDFASTFVNMGIMGLIASGFVLLLGGEFNGPVIGAILTVVGFAAFGKHPANTVPVLVGVILGSLVKIWDPSATTVIIAGLFATTLAPISGQYGPFAGVLAGFFHLSIVHNVGVLHGGINLYNNGFAGGFVASFLSPIFEAFSTREAKREE
ncbi:MAG: DUF1576 domain-containing protein [Spirochaetaceae bacterium]